MLSALACLPLASATAALQAQAMKVNFSPDDSSRLGIAASMIYNSNSKSNSNSVNALTMVIVATIKLQQALSRLIRKKQSQ